MSFVPCPRCAPGSNKPVGHDGPHVYAQQRSRQQILETQRRHMQRLRRARSTNRNSCHVAVLYDIDTINYQDDLSYLGRMNARCPHCGTKLFNQELCLGSKYGKFSQCCENGAIMIPPFSPPPRVSTMIGVCVCTYYFLCV